MKENAKTRNNTQFEYFFLGGLVFSLSVFIFIGLNPLKRSHEAHRSIVVAEMSDSYASDYNRFWQKLNTLAVLGSRVKEGGMVSQADIEIYKLKFFDKYKLTIDNDSGYVLGDNGEAVSPTKLFCLLESYNFDKDGDC